MNSLEFLTNHFKSYYPKDTYIYVVFFTLLEHNKVENVNDLNRQLDRIEENLTRNDINLLINFSSDIDNIDFISRLFINTIRTTIPSIFKDIVIEELYTMKLHSSNRNKEKQFNLLKYYFPYNNPIFELNSYRRFKSRIYYFLRKQLLASCNTKEEMINKLKYNEEFIFYIVNRFYEEDKEIVNKKMFEKQVYEVCNELIRTLELSEMDMKENYYNHFALYKTIIIKKFGM